MIKKFYDSGSAFDQAAPIDPDKAKAFIKERLEKNAVDISGNEKGNGVQMNLNEEEMGISPSDTLEGAITEEKYGLGVQSRVRELRTKIDSFYLTAKQLEKFTIFKGRELSLAITQFQSARQFCGKLLAELGAGTPYPKDAIAERTDQGEVIHFTELTSLFADDTEGVDLAIKILAEFRDMVEDVITDISIFGTNVAVSAFKEYVCILSITQHTISGKHWLGEIMAVINGKNK